MPEAGESREGEITKDQEKKIRSNVYAHFLDQGYGFQECIYMPELIKSYALIMFNLFSINYASIKL